MGTQVTVKAYNDGKQDMTVLPVLGGAIVVGPGELVLWLGDDALLNQTEGKSVLDQCMDKLQELDVPGLAQVTTAFGIIGGGESNISFTQGAAAPVIAESQALVSYDVGYTGIPASTQLVRGMFKRAWEKLLEEKLKVS